MKLRLILLPLIAALTAHADIEMRQKVEVSGKDEPQTQSLVVKIKDSGLRLDMGSLMSVLMTEEADGFISLVHEQKMAIRIPKGSIEAPDQNRGRPKSGAAAQGRRFQANGKKGNHCRA